MLQCVGGERKAVALGVGGFSVGFRGLCLGLF